MSPPNSCVAQTSPRRRRPGRCRPPTPLCTGWYSRPVGTRPWPARGPVTAKAQERQEEQIPKLGFLAKVIGRDSRIDVTQGPYALLAVLLRAEKRVEVSRSPAVIGLRYARAALARPP